MRKFAPFLLIPLLLAALLAPFASSLPDGLEWVSQKLGFEHKAVSQPIVSSPFPDYRIPGMSESPLSTALAGILGTLICFALSFSLYLLIRRK
jgi:hypothetical protein